MRMIRYSVYLRARAELYHLFYKVDKVIPSVIVLLYMQITTVTQKGQVTIPKYARKSLGIRPRGKVKIEIKANYIKISPAITILDLAGKLIPRAHEGVDPVKAREEMGEKYLKYDKKLLERI